MVQTMAPIAMLRKRSGMAERQLARTCGLARGSLRSMVRGENVTVITYDRVARALGRTVVVVMHPSASCDSYASTVAVSQRVIADGTSSWPIHFMELVDAFRGTLDPRLVLLPPLPGLAEELHALLASIVFALAEAAAIDPPDWAKRRYFLAEPFFPAATESLKASALLESPLAFRRNNIFVLANFLDRA